MKTPEIHMRSGLVLAGGLVLLFASAIAAIGIGSVYIPPQTVVQVLFSDMFHTDSTEFIVIINMRLPRILASACGGGALALSGLLLQILFRNPIADPYVLGISSGARLFVGLVMLTGLTMGFSITDPWFLFLGAFLGALLNMVLILAFAFRLKSVTTLLIVGTMLGYLCSSLVGVLTAFSDDSSLADFTRWGMGSFGMMTWEQIRVLVCVCSVLFVLTFLQSKNLNILRLGESYAKTMGVQTNKMRLQIILFSGVLTAVVTAFAGIISFVGMSVPHICRLLLQKEDNRILIPAVIIHGGVFGIVCDLIARTIAAPSELAIGTITSFIGVPIVLFLLIKKNRGSV